MNAEKVSIIIVTYNSEKDIQKLLPSLLSQTYKNFEIILVDNNSQDRSVELTKNYFSDAKVIKNSENLGFAHAVNQGIKVSSGEFILLLNPDTMFKEDFIEILVKKLKEHPEAGGACGKLLTEDGKKIDSAGIFFSPFLRHFDRGQGEEPEKYALEVYVFGVSGASALFRRKMLEDVKIDEEYFDSSFFAYREDADLCWRAQLLGWKFLYVPSAIGFHKRRVFPGKRKELPAFINMHSVKNRFLMRIKNQTLFLFFTLFFPSLIRDLGIIIYIPLFERTSLKAFKDIFSLLPRALKWRRKIMKKKRVSSLKIIPWFLWRKEERTYLKIAFMGTRGVPAGYSGFETFVEQAGKRLSKSHRVFVYNRSHYIKIKGEYLGMKLIRIPTIPLKHTDTIVHTFLSVLHGAFMGYDIVYICGVGNSILSFIPRLYGAKTFLNVDGKDWAREKWGRFAKWFLKTSEKIATIFPDIVIADSKAVEDYYLQTYGKKTVMIPYGAEMRHIPPSRCLHKFGLEPGKYILFVGRLVPENGAHIIIDAYKKIEKTSFPLVIVGDAPYMEKYKAELKRKAEEIKSPKKVIFTGFLLGDDYMEISSHPYIYVLASGVGGTHPVLVEQMKAGNCVLVNSVNPANIEVVEKTGLYFDGNKGSEDLKEKIEYLLQNPEVVAQYRELARKRAEEIYNWERITKRYEELFLIMKAGRKPE
jgi:GT2 family glycosyltransferase